MHCDVTLGVKFPLLETVRIGYSIFADGRLGSSAAKSRHCNNAKHYVCNALVSGRRVAFGNAAVASGDFCYTRLIGLRFEANRMQARLAV